MHTEKIARDRKSAAADARSGATPTEGRLPGSRPLMAVLLATTLLAGGLTGSGHAAESEDIRGPDITIIEEEDRTVLEYRQGGLLRMVKIVPAWGKPYYLVPMDQTAGYDDLQRAETLLPSWIIIEF